MVPWKCFCGCAKKSTWYIVAVSDTTRSGGNKQTVPYINRCGLHVQSGPVHTSRCTLCNRVMCSSVSHFQVQVEQQWLLKKHSGYLETCVCVKALTHFLLHCLARQTDSTTWQTVFYTYWGNWEPCKSYSVWFDVIITTDNSRGGSVVDRSHTGLTSVHSTQNLES